MKNRPSIIASIVLPLVLVFSLVLSTGFIDAGVQASYPVDILPSLQILSSTADGVEFEVSVDVDGLVVEEVEAGGKVYSKLSLPGWAMTYGEGLPVLPVEVAQLGVPFGAEVVVEVTPGEARVVALSSPVLPGVTKVVGEGLPVEEDGGLVLPEVVEVYEENGGVYGGGVYPGVLAEVSGDGVVRQQRVVGVSVYPVRYDAARQELVVYETMNVSVRFVGGMGADGFGLSVESDAYEALFSQQLLNYEAARGYRESVGGMESLPVESAVQGMEVNEVGGWTPPNPGWRVKVQEDGLYKLTYEELGAAGLPVASLDAGTLQMYHLGEEVAIWVELGDDGVFNAGDYVVFYGKGIESKYTRDNVYWLTYGKAVGLRMGSRASVSNARKIPASYTEKTHREGGGYYLSKIDGIGSKEHFMWGRLFPSQYPNWSTTFTVTIPSTSTATLTVLMRGGFNSTSINPDHHVKVTLNGTQIGDIKFDGISWYTAVLSVPAGLLKSSPNTNTLLFNAPMDLGLTYDLVYVDWFELEYLNTFTAQNDGILFNYADTGTWKYQVNGFSTNLVQAYDVTNPLMPIRITGTSITGSGAYTLEFGDDVAGEKRYWTGSSTALKSVTAIETDSPSSLQTAQNAADYIIITHPAFTNAANTLRSYRTAHGLRAVTVEIQNVYDEFSYGITDAAAIRAFLGHAYTNWVRPAPSYVVLLGDGNYDPKNYLGFGRTSYIPPYLLDVDPWIQETAGDNRYVTLSGTDVMPEIMLGRLAVNSAAEADAMVAKIVAYESNTTPGDWRQQFLAVADNADAAGYFNNISDALVNCCVPASVATTRVYLGVTHPDAASAKSAILSNYGKFIVNYIGHGYSTGWAAESLFTTSSVNTLANGGQQPIVLVMACLEGYYINPNPAQDSLAEVNSRAVNKGAIASWSATGQGDAGGHDYMNRAFLNAVYVSGVQTVGLATQAGKQALFAIGASPDLLDTYVLFGDPALRISNPTPTAVDLVSFSVAYKKKTVILTWETASEMDNAGFNIYRSRTIDGTRKKINAELISAQYPGELIGAIYTFVDTTVKADRKYFYWLESVDLDGTTTLHGPIKIKTVKK